MEEQWNVNLEVLKGCQNTKCVCWNKTCRQDGTIKEMDFELLNTVLKVLVDYPVSNIALYGLGEPLYHSNLARCVTMARRLKVPLHLNTDANMLKVSRKIPAVDYFNICHKETITQDIIMPDVPASKVTHIFILREISKKKLLEIDNYIGQMIKSGNLNHHYMIGSMWDMGFGQGVPKQHPLPVKDGIEILGPQPKKKQCKKIYVGVDGTIKKCFFSKKTYSLRNLCDNYDYKECSECKMGAYKYVIKV